MSILQAKQINKLLTGYITISSKVILTGTSSVDITSELTALLPTAGFMGSVLNDVESTAENEKGLVSQTPYNYVNILVNPSETKLVSIGKDIYGRLTKVGLNWIVNFYYFNPSGVETSYTLINNYNIRLNIPYRFELKNLPTDFVIKLAYDKITGGNSIFDNSHTDPRFNVVVGLGAGDGLSTGTGGDNTVLGYKTGFSNIIGNRNVFIGYKAGYNELGSDMFYLSNSDTNFPLMYGDFSLPALDINGQLFVEEELVAIADLFAYQRIFYAADNVTLAQATCLTIEDNIIKQQPVNLGTTKEVLTVTAPNTLSNLSSTPSDLDRVILTVNGEAIHYLGAPHAYTIVGNVITWDSVVAGYNLAVTDKVVIEYS